MEQTAAIVTPLAGLMWLACLNWRLALLAVLTLPIYALAYTLMMRGFGDKMQLLDKSMTRVSAAIVEFVHGIAVVKAFGGSARPIAAIDRPSTSSASSTLAGCVRCCAWKPFPPWP